MIKKFFLVIGVFFTLFLLGQGGGENQSNLQVEVQSQSIEKTAPRKDSSSEKVDIAESLKYIESFNDYINNSSLNFISGEFEQKLLVAMKSSIVVVKDSLDSLKESMNTRKDQYDREYMLRGVSFYRPDALIIKNYYFYINDYVSSDFFLVKSIRFLEGINEIYEREAYLMSNLLGKDIIRDTVYEFKYLLAITYFYQGSYLSLKKSIKIFEEIIGNNNLEISYAKDDKEKALVHTYLSSIYDIIANHLEYWSIADHEKRDYARRHLYHLWQMTLSTHRENQDILDVKLKRLLMSYYKVIDKNSEAFRTLYAKYIKEMVQEGLLKH